MAHHCHVEDSDFGAQVARFLSAPPADEDAPTIYFQELALGLVRRGQDGIDFLLTQLSSGNDDRARAAVFALTSDLSQSTLEQRLRLTDILFAFFTSPTQDAR